MQRPPSRSKVLAISGGLAVLAAAVPGLRLRGEPKILERSGGVTIERVDEALVPQGGRLDAREGDLAIANGEVQVVVGASSRGERRLDYGAILDVTGPGWSDDGIGAIRTTLTVGGRRAALVTERVEAVPGRDVPTLRIGQREPASGVVLTTVIALRAKTATIDISTRALNRGARPVTLRVGDDVDWSGVATFAPGHGEVEEPGRKSLSWFARRGPLTYGLVFPDVPADVEFRAHQSETDQTAWAPAVELAVGESTTHHRVLVATRRRVSDVARLAAALVHQPIGVVTGVLDPAPPWALLTAIASDGTIALKDAARDDGSFELSLPPGRYTLVLQTPGGWDETLLDVPPGPKPTVARLLTPQPERLDFRITDVQGRPLPGRLIVVGVEGTPDPRFTSLPRLSAAGNEVHSATGEGRVDIPAGRYRVVVSRGTEWSVAEKTIDVKPEQGVALRVALTHEVPTPGWISADLHLHARPSGDSELPLDDRVASLVAAGVEFAVATDHNHVTDYDPVIDSLGAHTHLKATPGVEITTRTWGHFNAYPLRPTDQPPSHAEDPPQIFAAVRKLAPEAVIQVNHPWRPGYGYFHRAALNERTGAVWRKQFSFDFDLIEVVNGYELGADGVLERNLARYQGLVNLGHHYTAVGSSDSHKLTNEWAGYPRTYVRVVDDRPEHVTAKEVAAALRAGHTIVSLGPFVDAHVGEAGPGDTVATEPGTVPLDVTVRAASWIHVTRVDVVVNGDTVDAFDVGASGHAGNVRWAQIVDVPVARDSWLQVVVHGERTIDEVLPGLHVQPFAFTNPIWIDVGEPPPPPAPHPRRRRAAHGLAAPAATPASPDSGDEDAPVMPDPTHEAGLGDTERD